MNAVTFSRRRIPLTPNSHQRQHFSAMEVLYNQAFLQTHGDSGFSFTAQPSVHFSSPFKVI